MTPITVDDMGMADDDPVLLGRMVDYLERPSDDDSRPDQ